jgi:hypothetical protein
MFTLVIKSAELPNIISPTYFVEKTVSNLPGDWTSDLKPHQYLVKALNNAVNV